jgi:threonylcarbamoyladenosine tRNA methylthiotransferase MtaB
MRFAVATLGCKVNQYDSAMIEARLQAAGYELTQFDEPADVYVVNTCTVTDRADSESLRLARRARRLNPSARVIATGCLAQATPEKLARAGEIDAVVGLGRLDEIVRAARGEGSGRVVVDNLRKHRAVIELAPVSLSGQTRAFLKVQEGCDQFCTFCIVPFSRGSSRSVEPRRIVAALDDLHRRGFKEVVLTGVHLGGYGRDLTPAVTVADRSGPNQLAGSRGAYRSGDFDCDGVEEVLPAFPPAAAVGRGRNPKPHAAQIRYGLVSRLARQDSGSDARSLDRDRSHCRISRRKWRRV